MEDLVFGLTARDFLSFVDGEIRVLSRNPDEGRPHRLCPRLVRAAADRPFVRALRTGDAELLGVLARHPRSREVFDVVGPAALTYSVLPVWREHRLARTDWPLDEQAYALLGPEEAGPADVRAALEKGLRLLTERRDTVLALIAT